MKANTYCFHFIFGNLPLELLFKAMILLVTFIGGIVVWENGLNLHVRAELSVRNGKEVRFERMRTNYRAGRKEG